VTDDLEQRLRRLGEAPIDAGTLDAHRTAMAGVTPRSARRFGWKAVAAAAVAGFLAGSTGLAAAGALPDPAQDVAHDVLDVVGIGVPRSTEGCPEGKTYRNHGEYVSSVEAAGGDVEAAARSECGKPARGQGQEKGGNKGKAGTKGDADGDPCTGPPPWAGTRLSAEDRAAAQAERREQCGEDDADALEGSRAEADDDSDLEEQPEAPAHDEAPTTTEAAPETTTTTEVDTSTSTTTGS
jgi:hypothetical protein